MPLFRNVRDARRTLVIDPGDRACVKRGNMTSTKHIGYAGLRWPTRGEPRAQEHWTKGKSDSLSESFSETAIDLRDAGSNYLTW